MPSPHNVILVRKAAGAVWVPLALNCDAPLRHHRRELILGLFVVDRAGLPPFVSCHLPGRASPSSGGRHHAGLSDACPGVPTLCFEGTPGSEEGPQRKLLLQSKKPRSQNHWAGNSESILRSQ